MEISKPHGRDLRKGRISIPGQIYLVTAVTFDRRPVFQNFWMGEALIGAMRRCVEDGAAESLAFVIMPDHLHWLLSLRESSSLSEVIQKVKGSSAHVVKGLIAAEAAPTDQPEPVWQKGFHDRALRRDVDLRDLARYMIMNPVRAGIVTRIWDYPLWDAAWIE